MVRAKAAMKAEVIVVKRGAVQEATATQRHCTMQCCSALHLCSNKLVAQLKRRGVPARSTTIDAAHGTAGL